jgi:general secretion pathway protein L
LEQESNALYQRYFPNDRSTSNLRRRAEGRLSASSQQGGGGFLVLLTQIGEQMNALNSGLEPRISPTRISFDEKQGDVRIDMMAGGFNDLDQLKSRLATVKLDMEIASAANEGDKVRARVTIKGASS